MQKYFEAVVEMTVSINKNGKPKKNREVYLIDAQSVTEAEGRVISDFEEAGSTLDFTVVSVKESRIIGVIAAD